MLMVNSLRPRRTFLKRVAGGGFALLGTSFFSGRRVSAGVSTTKLLPSIQLGDRKVSRLIAGGNPIGGYAYSTPNLSRFMQEYFTVKGTADFLIHCEEEGITTWQSHYSEKVRDALLDARERGCKIQWMALLSSRLDNLREVLKLDPVAIAHHGGVTDSLVQQGKMEQIHDFVKRVHDAGLPAGISTHSPQILTELDEKGWENDFFMSCFYYLSRTPEERVELSPEEHLGYNWLRSDPQRMTTRIRKVRRPCLAFKILGAGRLTGGRERDLNSIEQAFAFAFQNIKPIDGVIVGMFPYYNDEVAEDAQMARRFGMPT